ncbi:hypothetical protein FRC11_007949 [Ceratobasidium sp. 423]|nr:hypothetical protein FRC11_007949 [Ceratobasidium sp. 423]
MLVDQPLGGAPDLQLKKLLEPLHHGAPNTVDPKYADNPTLYADFAKNPHVNASLRLKMPPKGADSGMRIIRTSGFHRAISRKPQRFCQLSTKRNITITPSRTAIAGLTRRMLKRPNNSGNSSQSPGAISQKRVRMEGINGLAETTQLQTIHEQKPGFNVQPSPSHDSASPSRRDPDYYFEDGNVIFQVINVLFKVHSSLLKLRSKDFEKTFNISPTNAGSESRGSSDENPVPLLGIHNSQFRHLMKVIYAFPLDRTFTSPPAEYEDKHDAARDFIFYVNVASLSHRFSMEDIEAWAKERLVKLAHRIGTDVVDGFTNLTCKDIGRDEDPDMDMGKQDNKNTISLLSNHAVISILVGIRYARDVFDTSLLHDSLHAMQYYFSGEDDPTPELFLAFLRVPNLHKAEPSLFGYFFVVLLILDSNIWTQRVFTRIDRMALFSARCLLTPLPDSLKAPLGIPLFIRPTLQQFSKILCDNTVQQSCFEQCYATMFSHWQVAFGLHYVRLADKDPRVPIKALANLPITRQRFSDLIKGSACSQQCYRVVLGKLDQGIQDLYTRVAGYYKSID